MYLIAKVDESDRTDGKRNWKTRLGRIECSEAEQNF